MKKLASILAGAIFIAAGGAIAQNAPPTPTNQPSGHIELFGGWERWSSDCNPGCFTDSFNGWAFGGAGRMNWWLSPNSSFQLDVQGDRTLYDLHPGSSLTYNYVIAAHTGWRNPDTSLGVVGAIGGWGTSATDGLGISTVPWALIGFEGLGNWSRLTLYSQAGLVGTFCQLPCNNGAGMFLRGTARFYPTQNILIEGTAMGTIFKTSIPAIYETTALLLRLKAETMVYPNFSLYVAYQGWWSYFRPVPGTTVQVADNRLLVGGRFFFGSDNLRNNDITGAPFDVINPFGLFNYPRCTVPGTCP